MLSGPCLLSDGGGLNSQACRYLDSLSVHSGWRSWQSRIVVLMDESIKAVPVLRVGKTVASAVSAFFGHV